MKNPEIEHTKTSQLRTARTVFQKRSLRRHVITTFAALICLVASGFAQNQTTRISGSVDSDVVEPTPTGVVGRADPGALQEIQEYLAATNTVGCPPIQATGTIQYAGTDQGPLPATLSIEHGTEFRLDVTTSQGTRSTRIQGANGAIRDETGKKQTLIPESAITGLLQFQTLPCVLMSRLPASFIDRGIVAADHLHRITLETSLLPGFRAVRSHTTSVIDFYFDSSTHLLLKSVTLIRIAGARYQNFVRTVTYGNYQNVNGTLLPFNYQESLNGEPTWSLQLTQVQINGRIADSNFRF